MGCFLIGSNGLATAALNDWACFGKLWLFNIGFLLTLSAISARAFRLMVVYKVHELSNQLSTRDPKLMQSMEIWSTGQSAKAAYPASHVTITGSVDSVLMMADSVPRMRQARQLEKYKRLLPYVTDRMLIIYISVIMALGGILTLVINITDKQFAMRP
ncbi:hypothetical protein GGF37_006378, partial [Kickxella alabastrina]